MKQSLVNNSEHSSSQTSVVILNGFLGSGKTTLFRNLLSQAMKKDISVCAVVNDMSELDIDGELIADSPMIEENDRIFETIPSCVLSSKKGLEALDKALARLLSDQNPQLVIIETSGSSHPMPLVEYFKSQTKTKLVGVFALVDSLMLAHDYNFGQNLIPRLQQNLLQDTRDTTNLLVEQIMFCSQLLFTKADRLPEGKLPEIVTNIQSINPYVSAHAIQFGHLPIQSLLELPEYDYFKVAQLAEELKPALESESLNDRPYRLTTRIIKDDRPFHPQRLWDVCNQYLGEKVYRSKGFFWLASRNKDALLWNQAAGSINMEFVGTWRAGVVESVNHGMTDIEIAHLKKQIAERTGRFGDRYCDLTIIGDETQVADFTEALKSCFLTDAEITLWLEGHVFDDPWPKNVARHLH